MYTYKVVIHPNNKQRTKILNTMNKCIECQNIIFDILDNCLKEKKQEQKICLTMSINFINFLRIFFKAFAPVFY